MDGIYLVKRLTVLLAVTIVTGASTTGCNFATDLKFQSDQKQSLTSGSQASTVTGAMLNGTGVSDAFAPGCVQSTLSDFMESGSWTIRRVEPRDCAWVGVATPVFSWPLPSNRNASIPMTLVISSLSDQSTESFTTATPRVLLPKSLSAGTYVWHVNYTNMSGVVVSSQNRKFVIKAGNLFAIPTGAVFASTVSAKTHPRALPAGSDFATIAVKASTGEYRVAYNAFIANATADLSSAVAAVPANLSRSDFGSDLDYNNWLNSLKKQAEAEASAIETLAYASRLTGATNYETAGITRLLALAAWPTRGATSEAVQDQANREIYLALAEGLDVFYSKLPAPDRATIVAALKDRLSQAMSGFSGFDAYPYNSHMLTATSFTTEALMYVAGMSEFPEANSLLASSWETLMTTLGAWGGATDGGYANGGAYGWYEMTTYARMVAAVKVIANINLTRIPAVGHLGDNQIAFTPPAASLRGQFGDDIEINSHYFDYTWDAYRLLAAVSGRVEDEWYWRAYPKNLTLAASGSPLHYMVLGALATPPSAPATVPTLPDSWLFEDAGVVAMHSNTVNPSRTSVFFRSSRFGAFNHSHADNNGFTFVSQGKELLISGGYYPYYNSPHHALVGRATRFKNALTFDGGIGQAEPSQTPSAPGAPVFSMDARGKIINYADNGVWAVTTGDATLAYRGQNPTTLEWSPLLSNAVRTVAYNRREGVVVIYDWATSVTPRSWELNFQSLYAPVKSGMTVEVVNGGASACIDVYGPGFNLNISNGFPIAPESARPDQYHTRYSVLAPSNQLVAVTVIREDCRSVPVSVNFSGTAAQIKINGQVLGQELKLNQRTIQGL